MFYFRGVVSCQQKTGTECVLAYLCIRENISRCQLAKVYFFIVLYVPIENPYVGNFDVWSSCTRLFSILAIIQPAKSKYLFLNIDVMCPGLEPLTQDSFKRFVLTSPFHALRCDRQRFELREDQVSCMLPRLTNVALHGGRSKDDSFL